MKVALLMILSFTFIGCATKNSNSAQFVEKPDPDCMKVSTLRSEGFSIIPFVGGAIAKSMLEKKAKDYKSNTVVITKQAGFFHVEIEADGYQCKKRKVK